MPGKGHTNVGKLRSTVLLNHNHHDQTLFQRLPGAMQIASALSEAYQQIRLAKAVYKHIC